MGHGWSWRRCLFSALGDIALEFDGLFIVGMGFFAAAHVCYVTFFLRSGAAACLRRRWYIAVGYAVVWAALVALLWSGLGELQIPVAAYSLLLTGTAALSAGLGWRTGVGGALFFVSDGLIALRLADLPQPPMPSMWIMSTYIAAQYLLASGTVRWSDRARGELTRPSGLRSSRDAEPGAIMVAWWRPSNRRCALRAAARPDWSLACCWPVRACR